MVKRKILIASTDPVMQGILRQELPNHGYKITSTHVSGEELRMILNKTSPDMVILDIMMPWLDGIELSLLIRQWSQVPIMMLSAWGAGKGKVRGLDLSSDSYLTEPFDTTKLLEQIEEIMAHKPDTNFASNLKSS